MAVPVVSDGNTNLSPAEKELLCWHQGVPLRRYQGNLLPGQEVCVDHFICSNQGRLFTSRGASKESDMYCEGAIFVDQSSAYVHVEHQTELTSHATL